MVKTAQQNARHQRAWRDRRKEMRRQQMELVLEVLDGIANGSNGITCTTTTDLWGINFDWKGEKSAYDAVEERANALVFGVNYFCRFRRLFLPVHLLFLTTLLGHSGAVAGDVEFQDDRVVDHPVDGRGCGHWVGEDVLPLGEDQVGRDAQGPAFVALGDEREEHLRLLRTLGQVSQVVQQQEVVVVESA